MADAIHCALSSHWTRTRWRNACLCRKLQHHSGSILSPLTSTTRSYAGVPIWCGKPQELTSHLFADTTRAGLVSALSEWDKRQLSRNEVLPKESSAQGRLCVFGRARIVPCRVRILDPKRKITVLPHPYLENYVVLPSRSLVRISVNVLLCRPIA